MPTPANPESFELLIRGGTVIDGTRAPRFDADVGIRVGRVCAMGDLNGHRAEQVLDARERIVATGFIDAHTHDDQALLMQPDMSCKISQGVITVIAGNCGISAALLRADMVLPMPLGLVDVPGAKRYPTFAAYVQALRGHPAAVNIAALVGQRRCAL